MSDDENNAYIRGLKDALEGIDDPYLHEEGKKTRYEQGFIAGEIINSVFVKLTQISHFLLDLPTTNQPNSHNSAAQWGIGGAASNQCQTALIRRPHYSLS